MIVAIADDTDESVGRRLEQFAYQAVAASVDHAGTNDDRAQTIRASGEDVVLVLGAPRHQRNRIDRRVFGRRFGSPAEHPHAGGVNNEALLRRVRTRGARALGSGDDGLERDALDRRSFAGRFFKRGVNVAVLRVGSGAIGVRFADIADDRPRATRGHARGFLVVANERGDVVAAANQRVEYSPADVARRTGQEDSHAEALQLTSDRLSELQRNSAAFASADTRAGRTIGDAPEVV